LLEILINMIEDRILNSAINSKHNWDEGLIDELLSIHNITKDCFKILFPYGLESLADKFFERIDQEMIAIISEEFHKLPIYLQVSQLLENRLNYMSLNKEIILKILSIKSRFTYQVCHILKVSDLIWQNIKHNSSGFDYYTRRMILANVYKNCLIYFKKNVSGDEMILYAKNQLKTVGEFTKLKKKLCKKFSLK